MEIHCLGGKELGLRRTVLVIGAGAGAGEDIGMPVGDTLKVTIGKTLAKIAISDSRRGLAGNLNIARALEDQIRNSGQPNDTEAYLRACERIAQGMPLAESIDHFVNLHRDDAAIICCAKIAIVSCILAAENSSKFYVNRPERDPKFNRGGLSKTWYARFLQLLCRDMQFDGIRARLNSITFIIFNYDRCVETFLFDALKVQTGESDESITKALNQTTFIHPYGVVAPLPWQSRDGCVKFGNENVSARIRTIEKYQDLS